MSKESPFEPKTISISDLTRRLLSRGVKALKPFDPGADLLYIREEKSLFTFTPQLYWRPLTDNDALGRQIATFLEYEKSPQGCDPLAEPVVKSLNPGMPIDAKFIARIEDFIPFVLPADRILTQRPFSSLIVFSDGKVRDLGAPNAQILEAGRDVPAFFYVDFPSTVLDQPFIPHIECPRFSQFLEEVLVTEAGATDPELILLMQEIFGFCLLSGTKQQRAFFFTGSGQNGKSIMLELISRLFPPGLVSALHIGDLTTSAFRSSALIGKLANIVHEEESQKMDISVLKNLISGEPMQVERKFKDPVLFTPRAKFFWASNNIPSFEEIDPALKRRIYIVPFLKFIPPTKRDLDLKEKLFAELPGIFHFAFEGAKRLLANNLVFTVPQAVADSMRSFELERYPVLAFFAENYEVTGDDNDQRPFTSMYLEYRNWCDENGHRFKLSASKFGKAIDSIDKDRIKNPGSRERLNGERTRYRSGIRRLPGNEHLVPLPKQL